MRAVRCDVCGAKAMIAAGKCPGCGHLFALRDGFGELPPLAYCSSCDSYYPESVGSCRWCGTQPTRPPIAPRVWYGAGAAIGAVIVAVLLLHNGASQNVGRRRPVATRPAAASPLDNDTAVARALSSASDTSVPRSAVAIDSVAAAPVPVVTEPVPTVASSTPLNAGAVNPSARNVTASKSVAARPSKRPTTPWVRTISRHWAVIRTGPSRDAHVVASIGPNSRVELGESRGSWRRIRAKGIKGWVEPRSGFEVLASR